MWEIFEKVFEKVAGVLLYFRPPITVLLLKLLIISILSPFIVPYLFARVYIVVESFVSLRRVPIGVYQAPVINFMNYIPHL
jgi:hypothetical protein